MYNWSSHSRAPFAGERRFSKSRGLSARVSFLPLPHPFFLILALAPISRGKNTVPVPFLGLSFLPNPSSLRSLRDFARECLCFGSEAVNASGEAVRGDGAEIVPSRVIWQLYYRSPAHESCQLRRLQPHGNACYAG